MKIAWSIVLGIVLAATSALAASIETLLRDASVDEAAQVLAQAIAAVEKADLPADQKTARIALLTAYVFRAMRYDAELLARALVPRVSSAVLPTVVAAAAVIMGDRAAAVTDAFAAAVSADLKPAVQAAGADPATILPAGVIQAIRLLLPRLAPVVGREPRAMPLAPPIREFPSDGGGTPPPPRVAERYRGQ